MIERRNGVGEHLYAGFRRMGIWPGLLGIAVALVLWLFSPSATFSAKWVIPVFLLALAAVLTLTDALFHAVREGYRLPRILARVEAPRAYGSIRFALLLEPSLLFAHDSLVAIYYLEDGEFERFVALGRVLTTQRDGKLQVGVFYVEASFDSELEAITSRGRDRAERLIVRPNVSDRLLRSLEDSFPDN